MRPLTTSESRREARLRKQGHKPALIFPTQTGMAKSIFDATDDVRTFLKDSGLHDYGSQKPGTPDKVFLPARFADGTGSIASLYRSKTRRDPRMWFRGLRDFAEPGDAIAITVEGALGSPRSLLVSNLSRRPRKRGARRAASVFTKPPPPRSPASRRRRRPVGSATQRSPDPALLKAIGDAGEKFVVEVERDRLTNARKPALAKRVEWVANTRGDGLGYDVLSFNADGTERWIEVKTTVRSKTEPWFISARELALSESTPKKFRLYRVFDFGTTPRIFVLRSPLTNAVSFEPVSFRATPK